MGYHIGDEISGDGTIPDFRAGIFVPGYVLSNYFSIGAFSLFYPRIFTSYYSYLFNL